MRRLLGWLLGLLAMVVLLAFLVGGWLLRGSLPQLDGVVEPDEGGPPSEVVL